MKWLDAYKMRLPFGSELRAELLLFGFVAAIVLCSGSANADFTFGEPQDLGLGNGSYSSVSADELELYFNSDRAGGLGYQDIYVSTRQSIDDPWGPPASLQTVNSPYREGFPCISRDGLTLYFSDFFWGPDRPGGLGKHDLWFSTRASRNDPWGKPVNMGAPFNSSGYEVSPTLSHDGLTFIFACGPSSSGGGNYDLWMCTRPSVQEVWGPPVNMGPRVNSGSHDFCGNLSPDGLIMFFESNRSGNYDLWMTMRRTVNDPWEPPVPLPEPMYSMGGVGRISADGSMFYARLSQVPILPIVDFNGDGIIDSDDTRIMIDCWHTDNSLCDIGPMPWGDGIVDVQDLIVLAEHLFEEVSDPTLVAHWPLDEAQGVIADDSAADCDGTLMGGPVWQPDGGMVGGALQFDGIDDYVSTDPVLNPSDGVFSVVAWVKGDAPGQVILSQAGAANWLSTDSVEGYLMTELKASGRGAAGPLVSQIVITDGEWHRIGLVWDGSYRHLYVDGAEVANDAAPLSGLESAEGGMYFGVGSALAPGTFFSGLIDDVRIYNRAVSP